MSNIVGNPIKPVIHFILVEPAVPGNIGASARALKTMGFESLILINPGQHLSEEARWMAHGSNDVLENAIVYDDIDRALQNMDFIIGTTAKKRSVKYNYYEPMELNQLIGNKGSLIRNAGIVFGKEESGLTNEVLKKCDILTSIPMADKYPSLNLSQAVMVYAHALSQRTNGSTPFQLGDHSELDILKTKVEKILPKLDIQSDTNLYNRIRERLMTISEEDIHLLLSFCHKLDKKIINKT